MSKVTLLSIDSSKIQHCTIRFANQLLHHGLARIVKFYPYTLQLKKAGWSGNAQDDGQLVPQNPSHSPSGTSAKLTLPKSNKKRCDLKAKLWISA